MPAATRIADPNGAIAGTTGGVTPSTPSPVVVIDLDRAARRFGELREALPWVDTRYQVTALAHPRLLADIAARGAGFSVANDLAFDALRRIDFDPGRVIHSVPGGSWQERRLAWQAGVRLFTVDDAYDLDSFIGAPAGTAVLLRLAPEAAIRAARRAHTLGVRVAGLSLRLPAGAPAAGIAAELRQVSTVYAAIAEATGHRPTLLDLGEIFAGRSSVRPDAVAELARSVRSLVAPATYGTVVVAALGRAVVAGCITIVSGADERYADPATASGYIDDGAEVVVVRARAARDGSAARFLRRHLSHVRPTRSPAD